MTAKLPIQKQPFDMAGKVLVSKEWYLALLNLVKVVNGGGTPGPQGVPGVPGPAVYLEAPEADEPMSIPGPMGPQGIQGFTGGQGPFGPVMVIDVPEPDEPMMIAPLAPGSWYDEKGSGGAIGFVAGVDFVAGTSTTLTLSQHYGSQANLIVTFDAGFQGGDQFSLSGNTLTFTSAIPIGTNKVYVKGFLMPK